MSYWDFSLKKRVEFEPEDWPEDETEQWIRINCPCNNGFVWGKEKQFQECPTCGGCGRMALHLKTYAYVRCPGASLRGRLKIEEIERIIRWYYEIKGEELPYYQEEFFKMKAKRREKRMPKLYDMLIIQPPDFYKIQRKIDKERKQLEKERKHGKEKTT